MCQRLPLKSGHLSVPLHASSIVMSPCPRHQRPALLTGVVLSVTVSPGIIYHKKNFIVLLAAVCVCPAL